MKSDSNKNTKTPNEEIKKSPPASKKTSAQLKQRVVVPNDGSSNAALKELAENYLTILDNSLNGTVVVEATTAKILFANKAALKLHGFNSLEELGETNLLDYIHPDDRERTFIAFLKDFFENTSHEQYEFRTIAKDGTEKRVLSYSVPIQYQNKLCGVISFVDITERKKMEEALRASEEKLRAMFESMSEAATITDLQGRVINANPAAVKLHRYNDKKEIIGINAAELVADRDRQRAIKDSIEALKTNQTKLVEYKLTTKGGTLIDGEFCTAVIRDHAGNPAGFIGISRDISDRKRMEEKLRETERKLETISNSIMDGLIITDMMGMVLDANEAAIHIGKYSKLEELIGRSGIDFITEGERKRVGKALIAVIADTKKAHSDIIEYIAQSKDGTPFYGETSAAAIRDSSGKPTGMIFVTRDVSERKRLEDKAKEDEEKLHAVFESMTSGICVTDMQGNVTEVNATMIKLGGFSARDELIGKNALEFIASKDRDIAAQRIAKRVEAGHGTDTSEYTFITKDGREFDGELSIGMVHNKDGKPVSIVSIARDITKRKRAAEELQAKERYFRAVMDLSSGAILIVNPDGKIMDATGGLERISGYSQNKTIGASAFEFIHPEDLDKAGAAFAEASQNPGKTVYFEARLKNARSTWQWTGCMITDLLNHPDVRGVVTHLVDITERKKVEEALRENEEKYREVVERASDGIVILQDLKIQYANPRVAEIAGYKPEEILGTSIVTYLHPDELSKVTERYERRLRGEDIPQIYETALLHKDGRKIDVELNAGITTYQGKPADLVILRNIGERKQAEQALHASEERYRLLAENVSDVIWIMDMNLHFTYIGPSIFQLRGYTTEEALKQSLEETATPATLEELTNIFKDELLSEDAKTRDPHRTRTFTAELKHKNGSTVWTEQKICFLLGQDDKLLGILGVTRDITERRKDEQKIRESEERYRLLADNISDVIFIVDLNFKFLYLSPSVYQLRGYTVEEAMQIPIEKTVTPDSLERITKTLLEQIKLLKSGKRDPHESHTVEMEEYRKDGSTVWVEMKLNGIYDKNGNLTSLLGVTRDISVRRRVNEIIQAKEQELRSIFESMSDCLVITDEQLHIVNVNDGGSQLTGFTKAELIGRNAIEMLDKSDLDRAIKSLEHRKTKGAILERGDYKVRIKDGSLRDVNINISNLNDAAGNVIGFVCVIRDITERKTMEDALRTSEERLRAVYASLADALVITDKNLIMIDCNDMALKLGGGYSRDQIIGHLGTDILHEDDRQRAIDELAKRFMGQSSPERQDYRIKTADGSIRYTEMSIATLKDAKEEIIGFVAVLRDTTERRQMEEAIHSSHKLLSAVFESMHDGIAIVDKDIKFVQWNQAVLDIAGFKVEEMPGKSGIDIVIPEDRPRVMEELAKQFMGTASERQSYRVQLPGGVLKHIELSVSALKDDAGNITGFVAAIRDVTRRIAMERELKKALDDLQRSNKELEQFAYVASHDLQEPLRMISSYTQLLAKRYKGKLDTDADEFIGFAVDGADRMQKMIQDLLTYSRVTTRGKDFEPVDLEEAFNDAIDNLKIAIEDNKATITHDPLPKVLADDSQMVRLFQNLIGNALKFHGAEPPVIHVGCKDEEFDYTISIKDNGIGIDKQYFNRLFIIFQRLHTRDQYPGTGIGLAVCKRTVERHGGKVWVESEGAGKGSTFMFTIPKRDLTKKVEPEKALVENGQENNPEDKEVKK